MGSCNADGEIIHLDGGFELQLTLSKPNDKIWLQLTAGTAEIFGSELQVNEDYEFSYFSSIAVYTWDGCILKLRKQATTIAHNIRNSTQVPKMKDLHERIEEIRKNTSSANSNFPVTLVAGPTDVGKSTLCRFLLNYSIKTGCKPLFVDFDVGQNSLSIAGTLGVLSIDSPSVVNEKFNDKSLSVYYFGYKSPGLNMALYKLLIEKIGKALDSRVKRQQLGKSSGILIDTCGWIEGGGYDLIKKIIKVLNVSMVVVISSRTLYSDLKYDVTGRTKIIFVEEFQDVVTRKQNVRIDRRNTSVQEYFYGSSGEFKPFSIKIKFDEVEIFMADDSRKNYSASDIVSVTIEPSILNQVLGLSYAESVEKILVTSIYGFVSIIELDMELKIATILSPQPGPLPTKYLLMGDITLAPK